MVRLGGVGKDSSGNELGPIAPGSTLYVPLALSHATSLRIAPSDALNKWTDDYDCRCSDTFRSGAPRRVIHNAVCVGRLATASDIYFQVVLRFSERSSLHVICSPHVMIQNTLPCDVRYRCSSSLVALEATDSAMERRLAAGAKADIAWFDLSHSPTLEVNIPEGGDDDWSKPLLLTSLVPPSNGNKLKRTIEILNHSTGTLIVLSLLTRSSETRGKKNLFQLPKIFFLYLYFIDGAPVLEIYIYSRYLLVNRTGLLLSARSRCKASGKELVTVERELSTSAGVASR